MSRTSSHIALIILAVIFCLPGIIPAQVSLNLLKERNQETVPEYLFQATSEEGFFPHVDDFRLERIEPTYRWIPIRFGDDDMQRELLDDDVIRTVELTLKAVSFDAREHFDKMREIVDADCYRIAGEAVLQADATYKLTWKGKTVSSKKPFETSVNFKTIKDSDLSKVDMHEPMSCACYLGEMLFSDKEGNLFLGQKPIWDRGPTPAVSFRNGEYLEPPDPGHRSLQNLSRLEAGEIIFKPPLAKRTFHWRMKHDSQSNSHLEIAVSDLGTSIAKPESGPTLKVFNDTLFRVSEIEGNFEKLRQDERYWKSRCAEILEEAAKHPSEDVRTWARKHTQRSSESTE